MAEAGALRPPSLCPGWLLVSERTGHPQRAGEEGGVSRAYASGPLWGHKLSPATEPPRPSLRALEGVTPPVAFRQQDSGGLGSRGPQGQVWLTPPGGGHRGLHPPGTHQVDDGDGEQAADGQGGQGQAQQRVGLHPLGDGPECSPLGRGWAVPLWDHRALSAGSSPGRGAQTGGAARSGGHEQAEGGEQNAQQHLERSVTVPETGGAQVGTAHEGGSRSSGSPLHSPAPAGPK